MIARSFRLGIPINAFGDDATAAQIPDSPFSIIALNPDMPAAKLGLPGYNQDGTRTVPTPAGGRKNPTPQLTDETAVPQGAVPYTDKAGQVVGYTDGAGNRFYFKSAVANTVGTSIAIPAAIGAALLFLLS